MGVKFADKAATTITGAIAADATSVTVTSTSGFPTITGSGDYFYATIERVNDTTTYEVVKVTNLSSTTYTIDRSVESSSTFSAGDTFALRLNEHALVDPTLLDDAGITLSDSKKITLGTGGDLEIYHDGNNSIIDDSGTGVLFIRATRVNIQNLDADPNELMASFIGDGAAQLYHDNSIKLTTTSTGIDVTGEVKGDTLNIDGAASIAGAVTDVTTFTASGEIEGGSLDINGNAAITGTVTIDPPLVTSVAGGLGAKGIIMKQGDLRMKVDGDYDADNSTDSKGGSSQNNSRIIFDSEQHEHVQSEGLGYQNPAFVIQANYNHNADNATHGTTAGEEYLDANISQLGLGNLTISSGKLQLRGKLTGADDGSLSNDGAGSDGFFGHESFIGLSIDGAATNGTLTNLHFGRTNDSTQNIRLQPSAGGIIVEGMGTAGSPTASKSNSGTIGTFNDEDLITLAQNQVTVAGTVISSGLTVNGVATLTSGELANNLIIESTSSNTSGAPDIVLKRTKANNADNADNDVVGNFQYNGKTDNGTEVIWAATRGVIKDATNASYEGQFEISVPKAGAASFKQVVVEPDLIKLQKPVEVTGAADISGDLTLSAGGDGALTFGAASSIKVIDNSATALVIEEANTAYMTFNTANSGGEKIEFGKPIHGTLTGDVTGNVTGNVSGTALTVTQAAQTAITSVGSLTGLTMAATSASVGGKILFKEGTDNGTNSVTLQGPASTADVTVTLPTSAGTLALTSDIGFVAPTTVVGSAAISDMTSNISKKYVHTGGAVTLKFPNVTASSNLGNTWVVVNAGSDTLTFDRVTSGSSQFKKLNGSTVASAANTITLSKGGVAELTVTADNEIIIFGSGVI